MKKSAPEINYLKQWRVIKLLKASCSEIMRSDMKVENIHSFCPFLFHWILSHTYYPLFEFCLWLYSEVGNKEVDYGCQVDGNWCSWVHRYLLSDITLVRGICICDVCNSIATCILNCICICTTMLIMAVRLMEIGCTGALISAPAPDIWPAASACARGSKTMLALPHYHPEDFLVTVTVRWYSIHYWWVEHNIKVWVF